MAGPPPSDSTPSGTPSGSAPTVIATAPSRLGDEHQRVAAGQAAERAELVAADEDALGRDAEAAEGREDPRRRVATCRSGRSRRAWRRSSRAGREGRPRARPSPRSGRPRAARRGPRRPGAARPPRAARAMRAFGGSAHSGSGIRSIFRRLSRCETISARSPRAARRSMVSSRGDVEGEVLLGGRGAALDQVRPSPVDAEHLGPAVQEEVQLPRPVRARSELPVHVANVRPAHDQEVEAGGAQRLHQRAHALGVGRPVGDGRPVPVEGDGLEPSMHLGGQIRRSVRRRARAFHGDRHSTTMERPLPRGTRRTTPGRPPSSTPRSQVRAPSGSGAEPAGAPAGRPLGLLGGRLRRRRDERAGRVAGGREEVHVDARDLVAAELDVARAACRRSRGARSPRGSARSAGRPPRAPRPRRTRRPWACPRS